MCGICGEVRFDDGYASLEAITRMTDVMAPRGPDSAGAWSQGQAALGHRRLRIIDLSAAGQQPMVDAELGLSIAFNG
jgi:asparagine synthase (glutamine-hydrolysing)